MFLHVYPPRVSEVRGAPRTRQVIASPQSGQQQRMEAVNAEATLAWFNASCRGATTRRKDAHCGGDDP
jgi:hypothetical protein